MGSVVARHKIAVINTLEDVTTVANAGLYDMLGCNRNAEPATVRVVIRDGALDDEDYVYYEFEIPGTSSTKSNTVPLLTKELIIASEIVSVYSDKTGVSFRFTGEEF